MTAELPAADPMELVRALLRDFPGHQAGTRPVHSFGVLTRGRFEPTATGQQVLGGTPLGCEGGLPVAVRFSNGRGDRERPDCTRDVRGMAVRFSSDEVPEKVFFDMICMTLPVFFNRRVADFHALAVAAIPPAVAPRITPWRKLLDLANLRTRDPDPMPGDPAVAALSVAMPEVCPALVAHFNQTPTESFATCRYHAVHAFRVVGDDDSALWLRFMWDPVANVRRSDTDAEDYLRSELSSRRRVQFVLRALVADQGDELADVTRPWPRSRRRLTLGHLTLDKLREDGAEEIEYNPRHLPEGITAHPDDEIFWARGPVYAASAEFRAGVRSGAG